MSIVGDLDVRIAAGILGKWGCIQKRFIHLWDFRLDNFSQSGFGL